MKLYFHNHFHPSWLYAVSTIVSSILTYDLLAAAFYILAAFFLIYKAPAIIATKRQHAATLTPITKALVECVSSD